MSEHDTIHLLQECDAGSKMAVSTINGVLEKVADEELKQVLTESRNHHEKLGGEIHEMLSGYKSEEKDPPAMAKGMSWMKTNMKLSMDESDAVIADLITDGCDMGVKSLHKYLNQYADADESAKDVCRRLTSIEEALRGEMRSYL